MKDERLRTMFWVRIIFFLFILSALGCKTVNDAPITYLYIIDVQHNICSKRIITDKNTLSSRWVEDLPLNSCDGNVSLSMQEFLNLRTYMRGNK